MRGVVGLSRLYAVLSSTCHWVACEATEALGSSIVARWSGRTQVNCAGTGHGVEGSDTSARNVFDVTLRGHPSPMSGPRSGYPVSHERAHDGGLRSMVSAAARSSLRSSGTYRGLNSSRSSFRGRPRTMRYTASDRRSATTRSASRDSGWIGERR